MISFNEDKLTNLVTRLESAVAKLESLQLNQPLQISQVKETLDITSVADFSKTLFKLLYKLIIASKDISNKTCTELSNIVAEAICAQLDIIISSPLFQKPHSGDMRKLALKFNSITKQVQYIVVEEHDEEMTLKIECVKNGIEMLDWLWNDNGCDGVTKTIYESIDFPANKILSKKNPQDTEWVKAFKAVMKEIADFVGKNYKKGLLWSSKGDSDISNLILRIGNIYRENFKSPGKLIAESDVAKNMNVIFKEISSGNIKSHLKPVQIDDKTTTSTYSASSYISESKPGLRKRMLSKGKQAHIEDKNGVLLYENFDGEIKNINGDTLTIKTILHFSNCLRCTFKVSQRINRILISNCEDLKIICDSLLSNIEVINSTRVKIQCDGLVNMFNIDSCKDILLHLSPQSAHMPAYVINSTEVKIRVVQEGSDGTEYSDFIVPEQFVFHVNEKNKLESKVSEIYNYFS